MFFLRMAIVLLVLLILPALYLYFKYMHRKPKMRGVAIALLAITLAMCGWSVWFVSMAIETGEPQAICQAFFPTLLGISLAEILICLGSMLAWLTKAIPFISRMMMSFGWTLAILNIIMATMALFEGNKRIEVTEYTYSCKDLPAEFDGLKVVHISDLHLGTYGQDTTRVGQLIDKTMEQQGDLVLFTGDLVNFRSKEAVPFKKQLARLNAPYGVYSILGNHDYATYGTPHDKRAQIEDIRQLAELQKECGWHLLRNENAIIKNSNAQIAIIGLENDGKPPFPQLANIPRALKGLPQTHTDKPLFKILMTHDPSHWRRAVLTQTDAQLTLSGHTHAMQFKLGTWSPASLIYDEWGGQYYEGARCLIVSTGLGLGSVPFRYGAWSEVCVITLRKQY